MLGLMRDPNAPTDLRLEMAVAAAPFVHTKPQAARRVRTNPMDASPIRSAPDISAAKMDGGLSAPEQSADGEQDLSPLNFLLSVMKDPDATAKQRIRAAKVAARYKHAPVPPDNVPSTDEYGFAISRTLAKAIGEDLSRLAYLESDRCRAELADAEAEAAEIRARQTERYQMLQCPPGYSPERDVKRWAELTARWRKSRSTMAEETEYAFIIARMEVYDASVCRTASGRARRRIEELEAKSRMRKRRKATNEPITIEQMALDMNKLELAPAEASELQQLRKDFPRSSWPKQALDDWHSGNQKVFDLAAAMDRLEAMSPRGR
jgi:hypothetical protein